VNENLEFTVFKDDKTLAYVKEPVAKTISDLISEMNRAIASYHAEFVYDGENFEYEYERPGGILIKLSPFLERLFGIPSYTWFQNRHEIFPSISDIDLGITSEFTHVNCDAIQPQIVGGKLLPCLKHFNPRTHPELPIIVLMCRVFASINQSTKLKFNS